MNTAHSNLARQLVLAAAALLVAGGVGAQGRSGAPEPGVVAAPSTPVVPSEPPLNGEPSLPCCSHAGQTVSINLSTGVAPWTYTGFFPDPGGPNPNPHERSSRMPQLGALPGARMASAATPVFAIPAPTNGWTITLNPAQWVQSVAASGGQPTTVAPGGYTYWLRFWVPACNIPCTLQLQGKFAADNQGWLLLNGFNTIAATPSAHPAPQSAPFTQPVGFTVTQAPLTVGWNNLFVSAQNLEGAAGMLVQARLSRICTGVPAPASPGRMGMPAQSPN